MTLIRLHLNRIGHLELTFVNARLLKRVLAQVVKNGGAAHPTAYLQIDTDIEEVLNRLRLKDRQAVEAGWEINVRMDGWEAAHYYGYDAHRAFEHHGS